MRIEVARQHNDENWVADMLKTIPLSSFLDGQLSSPSKIIYQTSQKDFYFKPILEAFHDLGEMPLALWENIICPQIVSSAPLYIARLKNVYVSATGFVITSDGQVVEESLFPFSVDNISKDTLNGIRLLPSGQIDVNSKPLQSAKRLKSAIFGREIGESGYFHLITSLIPRILLAKNYLDSQGLEDIPILYEQWTSPMDEAAALFGFSSNTWQCGGGMTHIDELYFPGPSQIGDSHFTRSPELLRAYESVRYPTELPQLLSSFCGRLFVSRDDAPARRLVNEPSVMESLSGMKFFKISNSQYSLKEQVAIYANSYIVVGAHGAGLSNIVFMRPGSVVVEILPPDRIWPSFRVISRLKGLRYVAIVGCEADDSSGASSTDFQTNPTLVRRITEAVLGQYSYMKENPGQE